MLPRGPRRQGVDEAFKSSSLLFRRVANDTTIVTTKQVVHAQIAVQKFCAISLG